MPPPHDAAAAQAVLDLVKKAKAELGMEVEIDEDLVRAPPPLFCDAMLGVAAAHRRAKPVLWFDQGA
jgi:hypothetical protein